MSRTESGKTKARGSPGRAAPAEEAAVLLARPAPPAGWKSARRLALGMLALDFLMMLVASCILHWGGVVARGNETTWDRAFFTSLNALTLTGFQQTMGVREMWAVGAGGPALLLVLTILGALTALIVGGLAAGRVLRMPQAPSQIVWAAVSTLLLATLGGAAALASTTHSVFEALFQSASAFSNSGLWIGPSPSTAAIPTFLVLLPLAILGGLGLPVLIELSDRVFGGPPLSRHSRTVLMLTAGCYLAGVIALILAQVPAAWGGGAIAWRSTLASCSIAAINTRSAGLPFQSPSAFTAAGQWILMLLMVIGASPAGVAGGLKTTTLWELGRGIRHALTGKPVHRIMGIAAIATVVLAVLLFLGVLLLASTQPQIAGDRLLFIVCSAVGNVGLSHDPISITGPGLIVLSFLMLAGRLAPLAILWWTAESTAGVDVVVG